MSIGLNSPLAAERYQILDRTVQSDNIGPVMSAQPSTAKGRQTRERIIRAAAELVARVDAVLRRIARTSRVLTVPQSTSPMRRISKPIAARGWSGTSINEATIRLLTRHGCEVVVAAGAGCCGALTHHLGQDAHDYARANILAWTKEIAAGGLDAIVVNASGCGTTVKDYGFMFRNDPELAEPARIVSSLTRDITELMSEIGLQAHVNPTGQRVAYHSACSLQHGQQVREQPKRLLKEAGFVVLDPAEGHLCCGSAGTYNLLQPEIARRLRDRKVANIGATSPDLIAAGNIGCLTQIASGTKVPVVHTVELLDWATGGPRPKASVG